MSMMYDENGQEWMVDDVLDLDAMMEQWEGESEADDDGWDGWPDEIDESMDGDHDSAMESAGWGTDEDYGYYGEDF
jgi:hypothetical protein